MWLRSPQGVKYSELSERNFPPMRFPWDIPASRFLGDTEGTMSSQSGRHERSEARKDIPQPC